MKQVRAIAKAYFGMSYADRCQFLVNLNDIYSEHYDVTGEVGLIDELNLTAEQNAIYKKWRSKRGGFRLPDPFQFFLDFMLKEQPGTGGAPNKNITSARRELIVELGFFFQDELGTNPSSHDTGCFVNCLEILCSDPYMASYGYQCKPSSLSSYVKDVLKKYRGN